MNKAHGDKIVVGFILVFRPSAGVLRGPIFAAFLRQNCGFLLTCRGGYAIMKTSKSRLRNDCKTVHKNCKRKGVDHANHCCEKHKNHL